MYWNVPSFVWDFPTTVRIIVVSVSSVWADILKIPFLPVGKTDFVSFWVITNAAVSLVWFARDLGFFSGRRGTFPSFFFLKFLLTCFPFLFLCSCFPTSSRKLLFIFWIVNKIVWQKVFRNFPSVLFLVRDSQQLCCLRIIFLPSVDFSWHLSILPFQLHLWLRLFFS